VTSEEIKNTFAAQPNEKTTCQSDCAFWLREIACQLAVANERQEKIAREESPNLWKVRGE